MKAPASLLRCVLCPRRFNTGDVEEERFFVQTMICRACYERMRARPYAESCFGKPTVGNRLGYDADNHVCQHVCPDRAVCPKLQGGS